MKIAVVAANGKAGQLIVEEALNRGHDVTAVVRSFNKSKAQKVIEKDLFDLTKEDLAGFDVVVDAFWAWTEDQLHLHSESQKHLADLLSGTDTRLMIVGGAGSLYVNPEHTVQLVDTPEFPAVFKPLANAQRQSLAEIRERNDVKWTFVSNHIIYAFLTFVINMLRMKPTRAKLIHPIENCPNGTIVVKNSTRLVGSVNNPVIVDNVEKAS